MSFAALKWTKLALYLSGGGMSAVFALLALLNPSNAPKWLAAGGALIALGGALGALFPSPAQAVVADAKTVTPGGTPTGATVVSTSSGLLPGNEPAKGNA